MGYVLLLLFSGLILAGCEAPGLPVDSLIGTWVLTKGSATARYVFNSDGRMTFDAGSAGGPIQRLIGSWYTNGGKLGLAFDGKTTVEAPFSLVENTLTITDDPATVRVGTHADAIYTRAQ